MKRAVRKENARGKTAGGGAGTGEEAEGGEEGGGGGRGNGRGPSGKKTQEVKRQAAYRQLFRTRIADKTLDAIREATNKAWALGGGGVKRKLQPRLKRRMASKARGGDHKSDAYRQQTTIDRV